MQTLIRRVATGLWQCFTLLVLTLPLACSSKLSDGTAQHQMTLVSSDSIINFHVWSNSGSIRPRQENRYHYYIRNSLQSMQGAFIGKPLHGEYTLVNRKNTILERGNFNKGMKSGKWTTWHLNGAISSVTTWKKGYRAGKYWLYSDDSKLLQTGTYKEDVLDGKVTTYSFNGDKAFQYYDKGILRQPKPVKAKEEKPRSRKAKSDTSKDEKQPNDRSRVKDDKKAKEQESTTQPKAPREKKLRKKSSDTSPVNDAGAIKPVSPTTTQAEEQKPPKASRKARKTAASKTDKP
jgi:antitoxin component YwqK of YwqJK toxin-antitoxin module